MKNLGTVIGHIPARAGSKRVRSKNLRYIAGQPLLSYSVKAALNCKLLNEVVVNTDGPELASLAEYLGAKVFKRDPSLASDTATGDDFTYDFIKKSDVDTLVMISPVCPLIEEGDITNAICAYRENDEIDTLITCSSTQLQVFMEGLPINIDTNSPLAPTQSNRTVHILNWAVTIWDAKSFLNHYETDGYAYLGRKRLFFPINPLKAIKISNEDDFITADALLKSKSDCSKASNPRYWSPPR